MSVMSDSVWPHIGQPIRLPGPWDSPGKNTGVGCHFLLQCMTVKSESEVAQLCPTLRDPMDCSLPGSLVPGTFQARVLEWAAIAFSKRMLTSALFIYSKTGCCCSVSKLCPTLCNPMDCSMPGFPVHHLLPEFAQTHVHWVGDVIQPSHSPSYPSPPVFNLSQHQGLF